MEGKKVNGRKIPVYATVGVAVGMFAWALIMATLGSMGMLVDPGFAQWVIYGAGVGTVICLFLSMVAAWVESFWA